MDKKQLIKKCQQLNDDQKYNQVVSLLSPEVLDKYKDYELFYEKARAYINLKNYFDGDILLNEAFILSPKSLKNRLLQGILFVKLKQYDKAINYYSELFENTTLSNETKPYLAKSYLWRGNAFKLLEMLNEALKDYNKAKELDPAESKTYYAIGNIYMDFGNYETAIENFDKAIKLQINLHQAYNNLAVCYSYLKKTDLAIINYSKAIKYNPSYSLAYFNRGIAYTKLNKYREAISDYKKVIDLNDENNDYNIEVSKSKILELELKLKDSYYDDISKLVDNVKNILIFDQKCLTHYTSLTVAKAMILDKSEFRLSEGSFLNDPSEGKELFKYLDFPKKNKNNINDLEDTFVEKPFIGSFVSEIKHNNLTLWRMYGKEAQNEAKGCAITFEKDKFIAKLNEKLNSTKTSENDLNYTYQSDGQFTFYKVAYMDHNKNKFIILDAEPEDVEKLNEIMNELQKQIKNLTPTQKKGNKGIRLLELLNQITYLFKSSEYQYEHEVRLVLDGVGFQKNIKSYGNDILPRVYIELLNINPVINKITLGPKVDKAEEWASVFNYSLKNEEQEAQIIISHLPFK